MNSKLVVGIAILFLLLSFYPLCDQTWATVHYVKPGGTGTGNNWPILDGNGLTGRVVTVPATGTVIDGFTITGGSEGGVAYDHTATGELTNCIISGNSVSTSGGGVHCFSSSPTLTNCVISGNEAASGGNLP